jgi:hypothetical protein
MSGHWHHIARWLRLGLTSLALVVGAMPAHALPAPRAAVTLSVEQRESPRQDTARPSSAHIAREVERDAAPRASRFWGPPERRVPETRPPGPPRRLFIAYRALLH